MKAVTHTEYGPPEVLRIVDMERPTPAENELLVRVRATTVTAADYRMRGFNIPRRVFWLPARLAMGLRRPKQARLGSEFAGDVTAVGAAVNRFRPGDRVFGIAGGGTYAEYITRPEESAVATIPDNLDYDEAAAIPFGAYSALYFLRDLGDIQVGHKVLIYGASGSVGTAAVQLARHFGAEVTGVCSTDNVPLVQSLGATAVLDYTRDTVPPAGQIYDIIFDTVGYLPYSRCRQALAPSGAYVTAVTGLTEIVQMLWARLRGGQKIATGISPARTEDLALFRQLAAAGALRAPIDRRYPLAEIADAHRYADQGHKKGNVVIAMPHDN